MIIRKLKCDRCMGEFEELPYQETVVYRVFAYKHLLSTINFAHKHVPSTLIEDFKPLKEDGYNEFCLDCFEEARRLFNKKK